MEQLNLTQEWDKVFPKSDEIEHDAAFGYLVGFEQLLGELEGAGPHYLFANDGKVKGFRFWETVHCCLFSVGLRESPRIGAQSNTRDAWALVAQVASQRVSIGIRFAFPTEQ